MVSQLTLAEDTLTEPKAWSTANLAGQFLWPDIEISMCMPSFEAARHHSNKFNRRLLSAKSHWVNPEESCGAAYQ